MTTTNLLHTGQAASCRGHLCLSNTNGKAVTLGYPSPGVISCPYSCLYSKNPSLKFSKRFKKKKSKSPTQCILARLP